MDGKIKHYPYLLKSVLDGKKSGLAQDEKARIDAAYRRGFTDGLNARRQMSENKKGLPTLPTRSFKKNGYLNHVDDSGNLTTRRIGIRAPVPDYSDPEYISWLHRRAEKAHHMTQNSR